ncbi:MAG: lysylphosphatidylglycerol synthase transmembrane domain-containing protein [Gaiellales bacterium]
MDDVRAFIDASQAFFEAFARVGWGALALAVLLHVIKLALRVRAWQNIVRAAYPDTSVGYRDVFGSYVAGVGINSIAPARGGDLVKLYLLKRRVRDSSYATLTSTLVAETLFDFVLAAGLFAWALYVGLLPGVDSLARLPAFDWSFVVEHPRIAAFIGCVLLGGAVILVAWASRHVAAFKEKLSRGFAILHNRRAFLTQVVSWQFASWVARALSIYFFLEAFRIEGATGTVLAVLVVQSLSTLLPFTPGGAGTQQAILVFALAGEAARSTVLAFSVGMQIATVAVNVALGFGAMALMLRTIRWRRFMDGGGGPPDGGEGQSDEDERTRMMARGWRGPFVRAGGRRTATPSPTSGEESAPRSSGSSE